MKLVKALASLVVLAATLVGVPILLATWTEPGSLLAVDWTSVLLRPDDGRVLLEILGLVGWLAWLAVAVTALLEGAAVASRGAISIQLPGTGWLRPSVRVAIASALAPFMGLGATSAANDAPAPPAATAPASPDEEAHQPTQAQPVPGDTEELRFHVVQPGEELWGIAERELGSGLRWREIVALNPGLTAHDPVLPGTHLALPPAPLLHEHQVEVKPGDTLWDLADEHLSDARRWPEIQRVNHHLITDPDHIEAGWVLSIPATSTEEHPPAASAPEPEHAHAETSPPPTEEDKPTASTHTAPAPGKTTSDPPPPDVAPDPEHQPADGDSLDPGEPDDDSPLSVLAPVGGVLAASIFAGVAARRRLQLLHRAAGQRLIPLTPGLEQFLTALGRKGHSLGQRATGEPTTVTLGWDQEIHVHLELERACLTLISGAAELSSGMTAGMLTSLMCNPWSTSVTVTAVRPDQTWDTALDDPRLQVEPDLDRGLAALQQLVAGRRIAMRHRSLAQMRADPDTAEAFAPHVTIFCAPLAPAHVQHINDALALGDVGVSVVGASLPGLRTSAPATTVNVVSHELARLGTTSFVPQLLTLPARRAIAGLFTASSSTATHHAPWWVDDPLPPNVSALPRRGFATTQEDGMPPWPSNPRHPTLLLLGDVELLGANGPRPTRAVGQCIEYCAWLLEHPDATPTVMTRELLVAESTRRSNMSRLRAWLGHDPDGHPYLPDAYSGHIKLHDEVSSDWERFCLLLAGGVNLASSNTLHEALQLVRGEPLHLVAFQWPWAEQLRSDMVSMITDTATVLAERALEHEDYDEAFWALEQGRKAAGHDETLAALEIQAYALVGDRTAMDRAVRRLTRLARSEGRDLAPETARRIQHAIHTGLSASSADHRARPVM